MPAYAPAAYGMYTDNVALRQVVQSLNQSGFDKKDICVMLSSEHPIAAVVRGAKIHGAGREATAIATGMVGWLMKLGAVVIPTVGFFIRSQSFLDALLTRKDSRGLGDHTNTLVGLGFSQGDAERCENQIRQMGVLVYVACQGIEKTTWAADVLRRVGAHEASTVGIAQEIVAA